MYALIVPLTRTRHIGHLFVAGPQSAQVTRWPHGMKTIPTVLSRHTLHMICSSLLFSALLGFGPQDLEAENKN